jgi:hypothetical protein
MVQADLVIAVVEEDQQPAASAGEASTPTVLAGILTAAVGWALLLPSAGFVLVALPFAIRHLGRALRFGGTPYLVPMIVAGAVCVRLGPRIADRQVPSGREPGLFLGAIGVAAVAVLLGSRHWFDHGWISTAPQLRRHARLVLGATAALALAVPVLLAMPPARRDLPGWRAVGESGRRAGRATAAVACAVAAATILATAVLAVLAHRS